jgi:hypothetical protein
MQRNSPNWAEVSIFFSENTSRSIAPACCERQGDGMRPHGANKKQIPTFGRKPIPKSIQRRCFDGL